MTKYSATLTSQYFNSATTEKSTRYSVTSTMQKEVQMQRHTQEKEQVFYQWSLSSSTTKPQEDQRSHQEVGKVKEVREH